MRNTLSELFTRFVAAFPNGENAIVRADQVQAGELAMPARPPVHTVLARARREGKEEPLAIVAMTLPSLSPEDPALLEFVIRRARAHKAPHFVTWTLRDAVLWKTPKPGTPISRDCLEKLRDYPELYEISASDERIADEQIKLKVLGRGTALLDDLGRLFRDEALELVQIEATYFVGRLLDAVRRLLPMVSASLLSRLETDHAFRQEMSVWAVRQGIAGDPRDAEFAESIARQIIYRLLGKVLFYQSLRRSARQLPDLDLRGVDTARVLPTLREAFARALEIDYYAVFAEDLPDRVQWPADASGELASLIHDFHTRDFSNVPQDVIGTVFEQLIPPEERHGLGQYFTPENLCDLILGFCVQSVDAYVFDPTCGTGTFLIRSYDRLRWLGRQDHTALLSQIWGADIAPFPAELATINLFRQRVAEHGNFPRIICQDFFGISPGQCFQFPPPKGDLERPEKVQHQMPQFDAIVGNFPFIRQEKIEKLVPGYKRQLEQLIARGWFESYPDAFTFSSVRLRKEFDRLRKLKVSYGELLEQAELKLSGKADILAYLFFQAARFVKRGGRMGIITSNAWLDVDYGHELQQFLLDNFKITAILESRCEPWFTEADVNTIATIVERCDSAKQRADHLVKFVKVKRPLADLIPGDPRTAALDRWNTIRRHTERIEQAGRKDRNTRPLGVITDEDDNFRIRVCRQSELRADIEEKQRTAKWGGYVRGPAVLFDIYERWRSRYQKHLVRVETLVDVQSGIPTRINEFFYLTNEEATNRKIEKCYLFPVVKSTRSSESISVSVDELDTVVFLCNLDKRTLKAKGHLGALRYIEWGETQTTGQGVPWPEGPSVRNRQPGWWALGDCQLTQICWTRFVGEKCFHLFSQQPVFADNALYVVNILAGTSAELMAAILNSSLFALLQEAYGRTSLGGGLLQVFLDDLRQISILDPGRIDRQAEKKVVSLFRKIAERPVETVFAEIQRPDREALDKAVLEAFGLDPRKYLRPIHNGLTELVRERIQLGKTRGKERKTRSRSVRAEKQVTEAVLDELLPDGPKKFPDDFFSATAAAGPKTETELPEQPLIFEDSPMFMGVHVQGGSFDRHVKSPAEGKFLVYAQQAGHQVAQVPEKTNEITRTVANYEKYLRELRKELYDAYYRRTLDTKTTARLTQSAFDRFHLPALSE